MPRHFSFVLIAVLAVLASASRSSAQETLFLKANPKMGESVEVRSLFGALPTHGYAPIRVLVKNGAGVDRSLTLDFTSNDRGIRFISKQGATMNSSFTLTAKAGRTSVFDLVVPVVTALNKGFGGSGQTELSVFMRGDFGPFEGSMQSSYQPEHPAILLSALLSKKNASSLESAMGSSSSGFWGKTGFGAEFDPKTMPEDWRAYSGFDVLMITADEWRTGLSPGARNAILEWNRLGGRLFIYTDDQSTTPASLGIAPNKNTGNTNNWNPLDGPPRNTSSRKPGAPNPAKAGNSETIRSFGTAEILPITTSLDLDAGETLKRINTVGLTTPMPQLPSLVRNIPGNWPLQDRFGTHSFHPVLFILVLLAFAILVGPVNLFVFAKSGRRHRLFITTPLISLGASALLVGLILLQDGFGGRGSRVALVEVRSDGDEHLAYVHQEQFSRTGVLLGRSFEIPEAATIDPVPLPPSRWARVTTSNGGGNARYSLQPQKTKTLASGDWFQSRSEQGHVLRAIVPTRGRIEWVSTSPPRIMSSFDFPIERLYITTESGEILTTTNLQPGVPATCQTSSFGDFNAFVSQELDKLAEPNRIRLRMLARRPGRFLATATSGPFIETYPAIDWLDNHAIIGGTVGRKVPRAKGQVPKEWGE